MDIEFFWRIVGFLLFAGLGYGLSNYMARPRTAVEWIGLLALLVLAGHFMVSGKLIDIQGWFTLYVNNVIQGLFFGLLAGFLSRRHVEAPVSVSR